MACGPRGLHAEPVPSAVKLRGRKSAAASQVVQVRRRDAGKRLPGPWPAGGDAEPERGCRGEVGPSEGAAGGAAGPFAGHGVGSWAVPTLRVGRGQSRCEGQPGPRPPRRCRQGSWLPGLRSKKPQDADGRLLAEAKGPEKIPKDRARQVSFWLSPGRPASDPAADGGAPRDVWARLLVAPRCPAFRLPVSAGRLV